MHMGKTGTTGKRDLVTYQDPMPIYNSYMVLSKKATKNLNLKALEATNIQ